MPNFRRLRLFYNVDRKAAHFLFQIDGHQLALGVHVFELLPGGDAVGPEIGQGPAHGQGEYTDVAELSGEALVAALHIGGREVGASSPASRSSG